MESGVKGIVQERIAILFALAGKESARNPERSRRYVGLARRLGTRFRMRLPKGFKAKFCKKCNAYWVPGRTVRVRLKPAEGRAVYECECGTKKGFPYKTGKRLIRK